MQQTTCKELTRESLRTYARPSLYALQYLPNVNAVYATGTGYPATDDWAGALSAVSSADVVIVASGINTDQESAENDRVAIG
jgi:hypothetical protein